MPQILLKHFGMPAILRLPLEILEEIFAELDNLRDLVAFALASRMCQAVVVPRHTQYRILRMQHSTRQAPYVWAHLARRSDLARNLREVHISGVNGVVRDRYPTTLIHNVLDRLPDCAEESVRVRNICRALGHMKRLQVFSWNWNDVPGQQRPTSNPSHENDIMGAVSQLPSLNRLNLNGKFAMHAISSLADFRSMMYPVWKIENLRSLSLAGEAWAKARNSRHICALLENSPNLEHLELPIEFQHLADCFLPKLRKLKLTLQAGTSVMGLDNSRAQFLAKHPSIEELDWAPFGIPNIPFDVLPNLKSLRSNRQLMMALNDPDSYTSVGLVTPPSTPVTTAARLSAEPPTSPPLMRQIENLEISSLDAQTLLELQCIDRKSLRRLRLHTFGDVSTVYEVARLFPNIEWLALPSMHLPCNSAHPVHVTKEQWIDILSRFTNLRVFRGTGLWNSVKNDKAAMHDVIRCLVGSCLKLEILDRLDKSNNVDIQKQIVIQRSDEEVQSITYARLPRPPRNSTDIMDGAFD